MNVNWDKKPEGATHFLPEQVARSWVACWYKNVDGTWYARNGHDCDWYPDHDYVDVFVPLLIAQPKPWSGPEDGLPPVGSNVQLCGIETVALDEYDAHEHCIVDTWKNGDVLEVLAHKNIYGKDGIIVFNIRKMQASALMADCYRPIRIKEQIIHDARETAIREVMDIAQVDCRVTAARLVDAGFKREVV